MPITESRISASLDWILFGLLLALCLLVGFVLFLEEPPDSQGYGHRDISTMRQGGSGERHSQVLWWGVAIGVLQLLVFVGFLLFGMRRGSGPERSKGWAFLVGSVLYLTVFMLMIFAYREYVEDPSGRLLSLPVPTAVMLFGLWPLPLYFVLLYSLKFDDWVFSPEDNNRFQELVRSNLPAGSTQVGRKPPEENR